ncbi:BTB/POZ domain-containing protein 6-like, partial [Sitodiplosis mosellana]|uniref:BTB/POZ domain-containing protein 6-like n=1 Tax=Sitodiplosis mosellana TaxID=263140 RepID=UPI002443F400
MFFGSLPEQADVPIVDAPVAAFKEFLQFFYLNEVRLSSSNIVHVTNLCKKYEMNEFLKPCETAFQKSLTMDDMCWGYGIAELLEQDNLRKFCAEKIKRNAAIVVKSESFLECDSKLLSKMLALVSSHWSTLEIVIACMEWSKAKCNHISLDLSPKNLRDQLKDVFCRIPFDKLTTQQISQHVAKYKGFFTGEELETLFIQTSLPEQSNPFDSQLLQDNLTNQQAGQVLVCDRRK